MTHPNEEIAALAGELRKASESLHLPPSIQCQKNIRAMDACDKAAGILDRLSATSPGNTVESIARYLNEQFYVCAVEEDFEWGKLPEWQRNRFLDAARHIAALVTAAKPAAWVVQLKYGPDRWSDDMLTDFLPSNTETYRIIRPLFATPTPPSADVERIIEAAKPAVGKDVLTNAYERGRFDGVTEYARNLLRLIQSAAQGGETEGERLHRQFDGNGRDRSKGGFCS